MAVLLVGNGINQYESLTKDWANLVRSVSSELKIAVDYCSTERELSMTLGFERFILNAMRCDTALKESQVKKKICSQLERVRTPENWCENHHLHRWLLEQDFTDVLTTNYDYFLELAADHAFSPASHTRETIYSMHRRQEIEVGGKRKRIWHIHGELKKPASVCLGYEQYMGFVQRIRSFLTGSVPHGFRLKRIMEGCADEETEQNWCHLFFTQDVHILGFGLDLSEADIWWLLNYRAKVAVRAELPVRNHIYFYDTDTIPSAYKKEMLSAFGVDYTCVCEGDYSSRYAAIKRLIAERCSKTV